MEHASSLAPAKLNLFLYVTGKRDDGYHNILTLMQKVSLYDKIDVSIQEGNTINIQVVNPIGREDPAPTNKNRDGLRTGHRPTINRDYGIPVNEKNTTHTAAKLFLQHKDIKKKQVNIMIEKHIPVESGMGGASSDAACVLIMLNKLLPSYTEPELFELSKRIGSDVPFFMMEGSGLASGRGEIVKKVEIEGPLYYVVVKPGFGIETRWAYSQLKPLTKTVLPFMCDLDFYTKDDIMRCLQNDLETVTEEHTPEIKMMKEKLLQKGAKAAAMTGSGSCVFGIFYEEREAEKTFNNISNDYPTVYKLRGI
jgi:4-diphosphocytidyl-2-C-methyl-D-erythritol kinase